MSLVDELANIDALRAELDVLRPLPKEAEQRALQKLRLEWNYHSAKIEGGALSFGETKALLLYGITAAQKPLKDHIEMKGHNEAITFLLDFTRNNEPLTEAMIRELHKVILGEEPFQVEAQTPDGRATHRTITPGSYKREPNHVLTPMGAMFYFAAPEETPAKMQELVAWYRAEHEKGTENPVVLAAEFHYKFVRIHPFDDGNGRMARLLMNLALLQHGLPPTVVRSEPEHKEQYYRVLQAADADNLEPFMEYIANDVRRSLDIMLRAARGEDIEDDDDVQKELALLKKRLQSQPENKVEVEWSPEIMWRVSKGVVAPLFETIAATLCGLDEMFHKKSIRVYFDGKWEYFVQAREDAYNLKSRKWLMQTDTELYDAEFYDVIGVTDTNISQVWELHQWQENSVREIKLVYSWQGFKYSGGSDIETSISVSVGFEKYRFTVKSSVMETQINKLYNNVLIPEEEMKQFANAILHSVVVFLKQYGAGEK